MQVCTVTIVFAGESGADESRVAATAAAEASTVYNQDWFEDQHSSFTVLYFSIYTKHRQHKQFFPANEFRLSNAEIQQIWIKLELLNCNKYAVCCISTSLYICNDGDCIGTLNIVEFSSRFKINRFPICPSHPLLLAIVQVPIYCLWRNFNGHNQRAVAAVTRAAVRISRAAHCKLHFSVRLQ